MLTTFKIFNFDLSYFFLECWLPVTFLGNWIMFMLFPVFYMVYYVVLIQRGCGPQGMLCKRDGYSSTWALKATLFIFNLLYLALTAKTLGLYNCKRLDSDTYYLVSHPDVTCFEGEHLAALILSVIPLVVYVIGAPVGLACVFYIGARQDLLNHPTYSAIFGFLYKRYELEYFWWHFVIILHKGFIVLATVFMLGDFMQAAVAAIVTMIVVMGNSFARPFASTVTSLPV